MDTINIGKVTVNFIEEKNDITKTAFEEDLLKIVRDLNPYEYRRVIDEKAECHSSDFVRYLYHLSEARGNIVRWLPISDGDSVLEFDAECGAVTGAFLKMSENVTAIVNSANDAEILAERYSNCKDFVVFCGDSSKICTELENEKHKYDWIFVKKPADLEFAAKLLKKNGHVLFSTDNRMGMRNLAGLKSNGNSDFFAGVEGKKADGLTLPGLKKILKESGIKSAHMYYPYPDALYMKSLFSDERLPKVGELIDNNLNFVADRYNVFSEKASFDASCEDESFSLYSNSYLAVCGPEISTVYARFSNDRAPEYCIYTAIEKKGDEALVRKYPISESAQDHIRNLAKHYEKLSDKYAGSVLSINKCSVIDVGKKLYADFEFIKGEELSKLLDTCLNNNDLDGFYALFDKYVKLTGFNEAYPYADIDLVFSNILVDGDDWTLVDYEWCRDGALPVKETAYRAIYCYLLEDKNRNIFDLDLIREKLVLSKEASEDIEEDEINFQKSVTGKFLSLCELSERLGYKSIDIKKAAGLFDRNDSIYKFRIYPGGQAGSFSEETAYDYDDPYKSDTYAEALIPISQNDTVVRVDPLDSSCMVVIREAKLGELDFPFESKKYLVCNGKRIGDDTFVFSTNDPNLYFDLNGFIHDEDTFLFLRLDVIPLANDTATNISEHIKKLF